MQIQTIIKPDIVNILLKEGIALKQRGKCFWGLCPLHTEKTPSFKVDSARQIFYCFGCNAHGDIIDLIKIKHNLNFKDTCRYLGISGNKPYRPNPAEIKKRELIKNFRQWCDSYYGELCEFYRLWYQLKMNIKNIGDAEKYALFYHREPVITYQIDILFDNDNEVKYELFREVMGYAG